MLAEGEVIFSYASYKDGVEEEKKTCLGEADFFISLLLDVEERQIGRRSMSHNNSRWKKF